MFQVDRREDSSIDRGMVPVADAAFASRWFAVYTTPRHEKRIAEHFGLRQIDCFLPLYEARRKWKDGSRVTLQLPLFPNYIFVRITRDKRVRVLEVPGVVALVGTGHDPSPVPDSYISDLQEGIRLCRIEPHPYVAVGQRVRITAGPMQGVEGILVRKKNSCRVVLSLEMIMQSVAVEVDAEEIEPAAPHSATSQA